MKLLVDQSLLQKYKSYDITDNHTLLSLLHTCTQAKYRVDTIL